MTESAGKITESAGKMNKMLYTLQTNAVKMNKHAGK